MILAVYLIVGFFFSTLTYAIGHEHRSFWDISPLDIFMILMLTFMMPLSIVFFMIAFASFLDRDNGFTRWLSSPLRKKKT